MQEKKLNIVVTGGHHTPALAVLDELSSRGYNYTVHWFGHRYSIRGDTQESAEYKEIHQRKYTFVDLKAGKFYRTYDVLMLLRIPLGFFHALFHLLRLQPDVVLSFGGYLAVPTALASWLLRIPVITHEQTTVVGLANEVVARVAKAIFISWPDSAEYFPPEKTVFTGNPIRSSVFSVDDEYKRSLTELFDQNKPVVYITGGKQGAHIINEVVKDTLKDLLEKYNVIHQCGNAAPFHDYEGLQKIRSTLPSRLQQSYVVQDYYNEQQVGTIFAVADMVVSRGGANTLYELVALAKPAVIIPLPHVSHDEQTRNARILVQNKVALLLEQENLTSSSLGDSIEFIVQNLQEYRNAVTHYQQNITLNGAEHFVDALEDVLPHFFMSSV